MIGDLSSWCGSQRRRRLRVVCVRLIWLCAAIALPAGAAPHWDLMPEDLDLALERGDLDADLYLQLVELFRLRQAAGDSVVLSTDIGQGDLDLLLSSSAAAMPGARGTAYEIYRPLRGGATRREWLMFAPEIYSLRVHCELSRSGLEAWRVLRRHAWWQAERVSIVAGSYDVRWIDGLLIGAAPTFLQKRERFSETLRYPDRGRLNGLLCDVGALGSHASIVWSRREDGELTHSAYGLRVGRQVSELQIKSAYLRQTLREAGQPAGFASGIWGLEAAWHRNRQLAAGALAVGKEDWAAQGKFDLAEFGSHRLGVVLWRVGVRFRNPLLEGAAESDREPVDYPELDRSISSAATGERGGELRLGVGNVGCRADFVLRYWREQPGRGASLRAAAAYEYALPNRTWKGEYRVYRRVDGTSVRHRHEWSLRASRARGYVDLKLRRTVGSWSPFGAVGGRAEVGLRFGGGPASSERQRLVLTYNDYDFAQDRSAYWAVRLSQALRLFRGIRMDANVRWRTAYHAHPADLSLRVTTRGGA